jgi:hypothetical protein
MIDELIDEIAKSKSPKIEEKKKEASLLAIAYLRRTGNKKT